MLSNDIQLIACPDENRDGSYVGWICNAVPLLSPFGEGDGG
jgi:hypothetical protein